MMGVGGLGVAAAISEALAAPTKNLLKHRNVFQGRSRFSIRSHENLSGSRHVSTVSALSLTSKKRKGKNITVVTAYDYPSAVHVSRAGIDVVLVGDSAAMVELGYETTQPATLDQMLHHCQSVKRGLEYVKEHKPLLVGDMPFGSYEFENTDIALQNAYRFVKEAGVDAVKLEVRLGSLRIGPYPLDVNLFSL